MHKNSSTSDNSSSLSCTPFFEHMFMYATVRHATTNTSTRLCPGIHVTAKVSTWAHLPHTLHHLTGKQSPSSNGSNRQGHEQAPQLQAANEHPEIQKSMEPISSQWIWAIGKWYQRLHKEPYQHYQTHLLTQGTGRLQERRHVQAVCMLGQTQKGWTQPNAIHSRGWQNQLPQQSCHPGCRNAGGQNAIQ